MSTDDEIDIIARELRHLEEEITNLRRQTSATIGILNTQERRLTEINYRLSLIRRTTKTRTS